MKRRSPRWTYAFVYVSGYLGAQLFVTPEPDPWVRIPAALLTAVIMVPASALLWGWVFPDRPR